ncbi:hypothetical protein [Azorhizobium sp. AG788]|uniref:hypothetical protein n=1 Tax=Azorhizobium sp. AG788 TaxID=2183897 RepID=UPI003139A4AE
MPGLVPGIHAGSAAQALKRKNKPRRVDGRDKPGHDEPKRGEPKRGVEPDRGWQTANSSFNPMRLRPALICIKKSDPIPRF